MSVARLYCCGLSVIALFIIIFMADSVCWYGHVLRREDGHVLRRELDVEVEGQRKKGRPKRMWKKQVEEESMKVGLRRKDALYRTKWSVVINKIAAGLRCIWPPSFVGDTTRFYALIYLFL